MTPTTSTSLKVCSPEEVLPVLGRRIAVNHFVKVKSAPGLASYVGKVKALWISNGEVTAVDIWGGPGKGAKHRPALRTFRPDRLEVLSTRMQNTLQREVEERGIAAIEKRQIKRQRSAGG